ncbi:hypothetical protein P1X14_09180, partial [Sphingomonas sp. AOB5]|nr:hypothetical protein [Sphingomonas sp. AOB5]
MTASSRRGNSIVAPIVLLVIAAVLIASLVQFAITFNGPPPFTPPTSVMQIADALKSGKEVQFRGNRVGVVQGAHPGQTGEASPERDAMIASALGVPVDQISGRYARPMTGPAGPRPRFDGPGGPAGKRPPGVERGVIIGEFTVVWHGPQGALTARSGPKPLLTNWHWLTLSATLAITILLGAGAWLIARAISHPIRQLAATARTMRL